MKAINEGSARLVEQVFIITRDGMLKQAVNARIYVLSRNKEESGGTAVEAYQPRLAETYALWSQGYCILQLWQAFIPLLHL